MANAIDVYNAFLSSAEAKLALPTTTAAEAAALSIGMEKMRNSASLDAMILGMMDGAVTEAQNQLSTAKAVAETGFNDGKVALEQGGLLMQTILAAMPKNAVRVDDILTIATDQAASSVNNAQSVCCVDVDRKRSFVFKGRYGSNNSQICSFGYYDENNTFFNLYQGVKTGLDASFGQAGALILPLATSAADSTIQMCVVFVSSASIHIWSETGLASINSRALYRPDYVLAYDKVAHAVIGCGDGSFAGGHASYAPLRIFADGTLELVPETEAGILVDSSADFQYAFLNHTGDVALRERWLALRHGWGNSFAEHLSSQYDHDSLERTYYRHDLRHHWNITANPTTQYLTLNSSPKEPFLTWTASSGVLDLNWFKFSANFQWNTYSTAGWHSVESLDVQLLDADADTVLRSFTLDGFQAQGILKSFLTYSWWPISYNPDSGQLVTVATVGLNDGTSRIVSFFNSWVA